MKNYLITLLFLLPGFTIAIAQTNSTTEARIGFYNIENLFDTVDDPKINDNEFLPEGPYLWTPERYQKKLENISKVIGNFGPSILGLAEIENRKVLEDLVTHPNIAGRRYQIIHFDMWDERGVDVALLYQPSVFKPFVIKKIHIKDPEEPDFKTRDILWVKGLFMGDTLHVAVNHWPSRRGGKETKRLIAAETLRKAVDSVLHVNAKSNIVIMGDLNDDPNNRSVKKILLADDSSGKEPLINTAEPTFKKGYGTLAYNGTWNLFDQIIISTALSDNTGCDYASESFTVAAFPYMLEPSGQHKGMPMRTFRGTTHNPEGFSDHLPVYIVIRKK